MFYKAKLEETGNMWDTWLYYHEGIYYLYYLANFGSNWDNISLATSTDGIHWKEYGRILSKREDGGGGCDTQQILRSGTPEQIHRHVKEQVEILSHGGGFVFQQVHNILADVPPENIIAMFEAVHSYNTDSNTSFSVR